MSYSHTLINAGICLLLSLRCGVGTSVRSSDWQFAPQSEMYQLDFTTVRSALGEPDSIGDSSPETWYYTGRLDLSEFARCRQSGNRPAAECLQSTFSRTAGWQLRGPLIEATCVSIPLWLPFSEQTMFAPSEASGAVTPAGRSHPGVRCFTGCACFMQHGAMVPLPTCTCAVCDDAVADRVHPLLR